jgi:hypothetical protein
MRIGTLAFLVWTWIGVSGAQTPSGSIAGIVDDPSGGGVAGANRLRKKSVAKQSVTCSGFVLRLRDLTE